MNRDAYEQYLQSPQWQSFRLLALQGAGHRCQLCNSPDELDVHHRTYERVGNEAPGDLTVLCRRCHTIFHEAINPPAIAAPGTIHDAIKDFYGRLDKRMPNPECSGIPTGFIDLDSLTAGLQPGELTVIASRPSVGKSAFAANIVRHVIVEQTAPAAMFSLQQSRMEVAERLLACTGRVDNHRLRKGYMNADEIEKLFKAGDALSPTRLFIDDTPGQTASRIAAAARRMKAEAAELRLIVVDPLGWVQPDNRRDGRADQTTATLRKFKALAREIDVAVIVVAQVARASEDRVDHRPRLADLREWGIVEEEADTVILLHQPDYYEPGPKQGIVEVIVAKQRNGPTGDVTLMFVQQHMRFENFAVQ